MCRRGRGLQSEGAWALGGRSSLKRVVIVGSITGNTNTLAGNVPPKADLGDLSGLAQKQVPLLSLPPLPLLSPSAARSLQRTLP